MVKKEAETKSIIEGRVDTMRMTKTKIALIVIGIVVLFGACSILRFACNYAGKTAQVIQKEIDPANLLKKYEWFKDASAMLDKHIADSRGFRNKVRRLEKMYEGIPRNQWSRHDIDAHNQWLTEIDGIGAAYTGLAASYNSRMAKINYRFCNRGTLPEGATIVLPREFKPYNEVFKD